MTTQIFIDPYKIVNKIDGNIYGQFIENFHRGIYDGVYDPNSDLSDKSGMRKDVIEAVKKLNVPNLRWPGGCYASAYHWENGIGDKSERPTTFDYAWRVSDRHQFGTDEFIEFCKKVKTEPYLVTNAGTGSIEEAVQWLEYCNKEKETEYAEKRRKNGSKKPFNVRYWSLGNENYGEWEVAKKSPQEFSHYVKETAKIMRRIDPEIKIIAPAVYDYDWSRELISYAGEWIDYLALHDYYIEDFDSEASFKEETAAAYVMEEKVIWLKSMLDSLKEKGENINLAFDEWNLRHWIHYHPNSRYINKKVRSFNDDNSQYTISDAIFTASFLNMMHRHAGYMKLGSFSPLINMRGAIFTHPEGIVLRPTYHVFDFYHNYLKKNLILNYTETDNYNIKMKNMKEYQIPFIETTATIEEDTVALSLINRDQEKTRKCSLNLVRGKPKNKLKHFTLTSKNIKSYNDQNNPDKIKIESLNDSYKFLSSGEIMIELPPHSVNVIQVEVSK